MLNANGDNRRWLLQTAAAALLTAVATKTGEWAVEALRERFKKPKATAEGV